jgi:hypothetical protein
MIFVLLALGSEFLILLAVIHFSLRSGAHYISVLKRLLTAGRGVGLGCLLAGSLPPPSKWRPPPPITEALRWGSASSNDQRPFSFRRHTGLAGLYSVPVFNLLRVPSAGQWEASVVLNPSLLSGL